MFSAEKRQTEKGVDKDGASGEIWVGGYIGALRGGGLGYGGWGG